MHITCSFTDPGAPFLAKTQLCWVSSRTRGDYGNSPAGTEKPIEQNKKKISTGPSTGADEPMICSRHEGRRYRLADLAQRQELELDEFKNLQERSERELLIDYKSEQER